jgi:mRNA-decapping enzyme subunit 2
MNLRRFCELIFQHCPLLAPFQASAALSYAEFLAYKTRVPVRGAILLNRDMSEVVLVKGWSKKAKWSFPRGKINKEERDLDCAIREVYEETGYDVKDAGLVDANEANVKFIDMSLREQQMRLYVFRDVPMDTVFEPKTRKEISKIDWFKVTDLAATGKQYAAQQQAGQYGVPAPAVSADALKASQFYMVAPFIRPLRQWIKQQRKLDAQGGPRKSHKAPVMEEEFEELQVPGQVVYDDGMMTTDPEDDGHFKRLLSGLHGAQQSAPEPVLQPEAANTADLSAQLKAMLSVGGPVGPPQPPQQQQAQGNPLMSILMGKPHLQPGQGPQGQFPPHTPLEQILSTPDQAHTPHHHHPRPPQYSEMAHPPPAFPISPPHVQHGPPHQHPQQFHNQGPQTHWQGQHMQQPFHGHNQMPPPHLNHGPPPPPPHQQPPGGGLFGSNIPAPPPMQNINPLQTGDPAFRSQQHFPQYNAAPPPQHLPKPAPQKLSNHAMSLLNVFKSPPGTSAQPVAPPQPQPLPELAQPDPEAERERQWELEQEKEKAKYRPVLPSQLLGGPGYVDEITYLQQLQAQNQNQGPAAQEERQQTQTPPQIHQPRAQRSRNAHQDSLLNLFKSAATPATTQTAHAPPGTSPVELAAQPSPLISRENVGSVGSTVSMRSVAGAAAGGKVQHKLSMRRLPNVNTAVTPPVAGQSPSLTSATVSGPLNAPNFETVRKNMPPAPPAELGNGIVSPSPHTVPPQQQTAAGGFQVLQRPGSHSGGRASSGSGIRGGGAARHVATPPVPVHTVGVGVAMEAPRPFHPTSILRRSAKDIVEMAEAAKNKGQPQPQPQSQAQAPVQTQPQAPAQQPAQRAAQPPQQQSFDRRNSANMQHKNALLSLFGNTSAPSKPEAPQRSPAGFPGSIPTHARGSGIGSPVSPLPSHLGGKQRANDLAAGAMADTPRSSRISSINSVPGDFPFAATATSILGNMPLTSAPANILPSHSQPQQATATNPNAGDLLALLKGRPNPTPPVKRGSVGSVKGEDGEQAKASPITPVEKSFLLGYLQGVVRTEGEKREREKASRQNNVMFP